MKHRTTELIRISGDIDGIWKQDQIDVSFVRLCQLVGSPEVVTLTTGDGKVDVVFGIKDRGSDRKLILWNWKDGTASGKDNRTIRTFSMWTNDPDFGKLIKDRIEDPEVVSVVNPDGSFNLTTYKQLMEEDFIEEF